MDAQRIKTLLISVLGESLTARIQGLRFVVLLRRSINFDPEVELLPAFLKPGDVAIDVGANGANWTYCLYRNVGERGRVFAFEADPYYALATEHTIRYMRMRGVVLFRFGLSDKQEELPLRILDDAHQRVAGYSYIDKDAKSGGGEVTLVRLRTLDSLIPEYPQLLQASFVKCDVEGYELFVFRGATQVLEKARPVVLLEIGNFDKQGYTERDVYDFFRERAYRPYAMVQGGRLAATDETLQLASALTVNRFFIPEEKLAGLGGILQPLE